MNIYRLAPMTAPSGYDVLRAVVVIAESETAARAVVVCGDECGCSRRSGAPTARCMWRNARLVGAALLGVAVEGMASGVVCRDFAAG